MITIDLCNHPEPTVRRGGMYATPRNGMVDCPPFGPLTPKNALDLAHVLTLAAALAQPEPELSAEEWKRRWEQEVREKFNIGTNWALACLALQAVRAMTTEPRVREMCDKSLSDYERVLEIPPSKR